MRYNLPRAKYNCSCGEAAKRGRERADRMAEYYPGVAFSAFLGNPLSIKEQKRLGVPGAGLPQAIFPGRDVVPYRADGPNGEMIIPRTILAYGAHKSVLGYVSFTCVKEASGLSYASLFAAVAELLRRGQARLTVNRMGEPVYFKIVQ